MKEQLDNQILTSVYQWFDHTLLKEGEAYETKTAKLYPQSDPKLKNLYIYASPHKQWVSDSSVSGAAIPTSVDVSNSGVSFSGRDLFADWDNGRVISTTDLGNDVEATYSTKNINVYITNDSEEEIIFQNRYGVNNFYTIPASGIEPYNKALPACFLTFNNTSSSPYALGSSDFQEEEFNIRGIVISNNSMHIDACFSIFRKQKDKSIPLLNSSDTPFDVLGGIKDTFSGSYDYSVFPQDPSRELVSIDKVTTSKFFAGSHEAMPQGMKVGFINFKLTYFRSPN